MKVVKAKPFPSNPELRASKQLGDAVRSARTRSGLTIADAAMSIGIAKQTLSDLELGKPTVSLGNALKIAEQLGVALFMVPSERREQVKRKLASNES